MTSPSALAAALRAHARGLYCDEAAAELLIAQSWLRRPGFASQFITIHPGIPDGQPMAVVDWAAAVAALGTSMPSSGGEQRMLRITASMGGGIPVDLRDTLTGIDDQNVQLLLRAVSHASGQRPSDDLYR
ncbi:MAG TPA: hypothetical protein VMV07_22265 [Streptosporangiaceae bacterium]|nr:hypothetical protein [Streptosporangiaceae bacterium]